MPTIEVLTERMEPASPDVSAGDIFARFQQNPDALVIPVVDNGRPLGLVERNAFLLKIAGPFGHALFAHRPVLHVMDAEPAVVEARVDVVCGDADWLAMGAALKAHCASPEGATQQRRCGVLLPTWSTCPADIRPASRLRDHFTDELIVMVPTGGEWHGAVFKNVGGTWRVVSFDGGDIP